MQSRSLAIILKDNKFLLVRSEDQGFFKLPGGKSEVGETTVQTLKRELKEELDVTLSHYELIGTIDIAKVTGQPSPTHIFYCDIIGNPRPTQEIAEIKFVSSLNKDSVLLSATITLFKEMVENYVLVRSK